MYRSVLVLIVIFIIVSLFTACIMPTDKVAIISLNGTIQIGRGNMFLGGAVITPDEVRGYFKRAENDPFVKAIVLRINSPGGDPSACEEIVSSLSRVKKPVVVSMRTIATSGGYYISAKADKIVALATTQTGSIGVITQIPDLSGLFDKVGIKMEILKAGKYKDMYAGMRPLTEEEKSLIQGITDQLYDRFINVVAEGRHMDKQRVRELANGQIYTGLQAKELGLVDEIGDIQKAIDMAAELAGIKSPQVEFYEKPSMDFLSILTNLNSGDTYSIVTNKLLGVEDSIAVKLIDNPYPVYLYR
jgi:protease-4